MANKMKESFSDKLLAWFDVYGRHDLPWQYEISAYRVWVSEIMLQQTQVKTVIPYYLKFMQSFPTVLDLASATQEQVLSHWAGLGYYARGRNLHKSAQIIVNKHAGKFPTDFEAIVALPGIGRSTAGAILSIALKQRYAILDGNVKRVLSRYYAVDGWPGEKAVEQRLWLVADELTPVDRFADYTQAIMDLGATLCTRSKPNCQACPQNQSCQAYLNNRVTEFPYKKPKKEKPIKQAWLLIQTHQHQEIYLTQRPQKGIWGGLWSLPEFESLLACEQYIESQETPADTLIEWDTFRHTFSHYHLDIHPIYVKKHAKMQLNCAETQKKNNAQTRELEMSTMPSAWYSIASILDNQVGLPAPVTKLLGQLNERIENGLV